MTSHFHETHRAFVNTWECDENVHMNVQFYLKRFDEAARFFAWESSGADLLTALPPTRHVRFHSELRVAQSTVIGSTTIADGAYAGWTVHEMRENDTGRLCATALDAPGAFGGPSTVGSDAIAHALPRSVSAAPAQPFSAHAMLENGAFIAHRCLLSPNECDATGNMLQQFYVARFTDGAPHVWDHFGIGTKWLNENGLGRVAVELKLTHHQPARAGDGLILFSRALPGSGKTVRLHHELVRAGDHVAIATGEVVALVMDLQTRKSVPLPETALME